ncbi:MAG: hypothetical protein LIR10_01150, partial [Bacillota bacterium]|nr:hypothetical protein [Bacillota bacterium]
IISYFTIMVNLLAKYTNKFLMLQAVSILVAKNVPQETWPYFTIMVNLLAKRIKSQNNTKLEFLLIA